MCCADCVDYMITPLNEQRKTSDDSDVHHEVWRSALKSCRRPRSAAELSRQFTGIAGRQRTDEAAADESPRRTPGRRPVAEQFDAPVVHPVADRKDRPRRCGGAGDSQQRLGFGADHGDLDRPGQGFLGGGQPVPGRSGELAEQRQHPAELPVDDRPVCAVAGQRGMREQGPDQAGRTGRGGAVGDVARPDDQPFGVVGGVEEAAFRIGEPDQGQLE